ncbi:hypothetical protein EW145_g4776 [Phellinidium pouzarii]|uniref:Elongator complex protein 1 n=1 Tax=Phellinidium pouzarii TaxID=167371 RepID=A0A4S4L2V3_9AGAM|nr:hypothetical protein EW145_g4776 [Phellinidium pouzarii]
MKSLSIAATRSWDIPFANISTAAFDVENNCAYLLSEKQNTPPDVDIEIFKLDASVSTEDYLVPLTTFSIQVFASGEGEAAQVVSFRFLSEAQSLSVITLGGDIGSVALDEMRVGEFEIIGSIDAGISAASWCPDESLVVLVTGDNKLLVMTSSFDVLLEQSLRSDREGEAQQVNVGWGSKQTQFHGSLGKTAAQATPLSPASVGSSPDDDKRARISWRGDGAFFVVSAFEAPNSSDGRARRVLRVYDRQGAFQIAAEPVAGLEHTLSWRPSGNLIASSQRFGFEGGGAGKAGRHDVVFFEKNGLRHGDFSLREEGKDKEGAIERRWKYRVKEMLWNADSSILAVLMEREEGDAVQLWTIGNYHWQVFSQDLCCDSNLPGRFTYATWHPENSLRLLLTASNRVLEYVFAWEAHVSRSVAPKDTGTVAVVDGTNLLLTSFRTQNIPPPMASYTLPIVGHGAARTPIHVAFSPTSDHLAVLNHFGQVKLWHLRTRTEFGRGKVFDPTLSCTIDLKSSLCNREARLLCLWELSESSQTLRVACLACKPDTDSLIIMDVVNKSVQEPKIVDLPSKNGRLMNSDSGIYWQSPEGKIIAISSLGECSALDNASMFVGRADSGRLYCALSGSGSTHLLSANSTSYTVASGFVIFTTTAHEAFFAPLATLLIFLSTLRINAESSSTDVPQWERRRVERGARIVTAVPSAMSLVLQMPRGNLETINPRPMVLVVVKQDIEAGDYKKAFLACRKHRLDLNILVEHNPAAFLENIPSFVDQIEDVDYLNLFLTNLGQSSLDPTKVSKYCDAVRCDLESRNLTKYVNSILTAHVVKKPADYEAGLYLLQRLRETDSELVEEAVKYIIFLVDADQLFDTALGMYDFSLVLLIAQHAQRDPREYLPFLRELRALPKFYQRHKIDDHLKRYTGALKNLYLAGPEYFEQALSYIEKHKLYHDALSLWKDNEADYERVLDMYGEYLFERREFRQAALVFVDAHKPPKALVAYERALLWQELFELAAHENTDAESFISMAYRVADELSAKKRFEEAARIYLDYAKNVRQCIGTFVQGNMFSEARRLISLYREPSLITEIVHPATLDSKSQISDDLEEMRSQLQKQAERLKELRVKKAEEPDAFYGFDEDPALHSVDVMTDISMAPTAFTRYTVAPTATSKASKRTSRSKRKMERKVGSGRKGTVDEEEYLLKSIAKLVTRFDTIQGDAAQLLPHLLQFTPKHRDEARNLQTQLTAFKIELQIAIDEIWVHKPGKSEEATAFEGASSWTIRMEEKRRERSTAVESILKPELKMAEREWKVEVLNI